MGLYSERMSHVASTGDPLPGAVGTRVLLGAGVAVPPKLTDLLSFKPLSFKHGDESGVPYLERGGVDISTCVPLKKKRYVVLLHVFNRIAFRWVLWLRARGKNATVFQCRAMRFISCG